MGKISKLSSSILLSAVIVAVGYSAIHRQDISDWLVLRSFHPSTRVTALADTTTMTPLGRKLFYVYDPRLLDKAQFNYSCQVTEKTIVLGCYDSAGIYLYDIEDSRLNGVEEVTSAHEMLHAAYERLSPKEKQRINSLLEKTFEGISDQRIRSLVEQYRKSVPDSLDNEMHSIFGTEVRTLSPELEIYYSRYFVRRQQVVDYSEKYEQVFISIAGQVEKLDADLSLRKSEINQKEAALEADGAKLQGWRSQLDSLVTAGQTSEYNAQIPRYNEAVGKYNSDLRIVHDLIKEYNTLVEQRNSLALQQNQLIHSIDSKAEVL